MLKSFDIMVEKYFGPLYLQLVRLDLVNVYAIQEIFNSCADRIRNV